MFEKKQVFSGEKCPACQEDQLDQNVVIYVEPKSKDELLIFTTICNNCKFKNSDIMPTGPSIFAGKKKFVVEVESQKDLDSKIFRSSSASIEIPELEIKLEPGIQAEFFITNIEGILFKFQESCKFLLKNEKKKRGNRNFEK